RRDVRRQVQAGQHQVGRLVDRVVVAVAEGESGRGETAGAITDEVDDGGELGGHGNPAAIGMAAHYRACRRGHPLYWADDFQGIPAVHPAAPLPVARRLPGHALDLRAVEEL